jgi:hypothetical protein
VTKRQEDRTTTENWEARRATSVESAHTFGEVELKRVFVVVLTCIFSLTPVAAFADHIPPSFVVPVGLPLDVPIVNQGDVRYIGNLQGGRSTAATFGENAPFVRDGRTYMLAGSTVYGISVIDVTDPVSPVIVSEFSGAFGCPDANATALLAPYPTKPAIRGQQAPVEIPFGDKFSPLTPLGGFENDIAMTPDGKIAILGMDDSGRCHDPIDGGLELVDISDVHNPRSLHLTRNVGYAHSVTIDPKHPWIAYISNSDSGSKDATANDFVELVDFSSCTGTADVDARRAACRPAVSRAQFDVAQMPGLKIPGKTDVDYADDACHDLRFRKINQDPAGQAKDRAYCAAIDSTLILDTSNVLGADGHLTGTELTKGPNACTIVDAEKAPGVKVTNCMDWTQKAWYDRKAASADMRLVSVISHDGDPKTTDDDDLPPDQGVQIAHQAEAIGDGTIMMITDERGGGLANENGCPGGGVWFWDIRDETKPVLMRQPDGSNGVYITKVNAPPPISFSPSCTAHYGNEFGDENLLAFAWYMNGTRVVRYTPDFTKSPPQVTFEEVAAYIPLGSEAIHSLGLARNPTDPNEMIVYTGDTVRGIDILGIDVPRITRRQAFKFPGARAKPAPRVLGGRHLANTGLGDPATIGLCLLTLAIVLRRTLRRVF